METEATTQPQPKRARQYRRLYVTEPTSAGFSVERLAPEVALSLYGSPSPGRPFRAWGPFRTYAAAWLAAKSGNPGKLSARGWEREARNAPTLPEL